MIRLVVDQKIMAVFDAARAWVEAIHDHPNLWAGEEEIAIIKAVRAADASVVCKWESNPAYEGWSKIV